MRQSGHSIAFRRISAALALALSCGYATAADISVYRLTNFAPTALSADGRRIIGRYLVNNSGSVWYPSRYAAAFLDEYGVLHMLPGTDDPSVSLISGSTFSASGISADGSAIVGTKREILRYPYENRRAYLWTASNGFLLFDPAATYQSSEGYGISGDGSTVVGASRNSYLSGPPGPVRYTATVWRTGHLPLDLGRLDPSHVHSYAVAASYDGSIVAGRSCNSNDISCQAFRWNSSTGMHSLGTLDGEINSYATDISADGRSIVGRVGRQGFIWRQETGMVGLGALPGLTVSFANAISANGRVVVGSSGFLWAGSAETQGERAYRWTEASGMQPVDTWLNENGVTLPANHLLLRANDTNHDGSILIGRGLDSVSRAYFDWIARVGNGSTGIITDTVGFRQSLWETSGLMANFSSRLPEYVTSGIRSRTGLDRGASSGTGCAWASASLDFSQDAANRGQAVDAGFCRDFGEWRMHASLGHVSMSAKPSDSVEGRGYANHFAIEATRRFGNGWEFDLLAAAGRYRMQHDRSYMNGSERETSSGDANGRYAVYRARVVARDMWKPGETSISPQFSMTHSRSILDASTETGGPFASSYTGAEWNSTNASLGATFARDAGDRATLTSTVEFTHRIREPDATIIANPGVPLGIELDADDFDRNWLRASVQIDYAMSQRSNLRLGLHGSSMDRASFGIDAAYALKF
ncbi:autotransporter domain-containing protein [Lysobacter brunescens]|uniref:Autotransporter domain-containing protein n=1 Tax=Lysobacter brunescens TaxID=262323 RepID=A0ABW2YGR5_9GAMM